MQCLDMSYGWKLFDIFAFTQTKGRYRLFAVVNRSAKPKRVGKVIPTLQRWGYVIDA
jgi:hypothetical protein